MQIERQIEGADEAVSQCKVGDEDVGGSAHARRTRHRDENEAVAKDAERQHDDVDSDDDAGEPRPPQRLELGAVLKPLQKRESFTVVREEERGVAAAARRVANRRRRRVVADDRETGAEQRRVYVIHAD